MKPASAAPGASQFVIQIHVAKYQLSVLLKPSRLPKESSADGTVPPVMPQVPASLSA